MFKLTLAVAIALLGLTSAATTADWMVFKATHGKSYGEREDYLRRMIYEDNLVKIKSHNEKFARGESTFYLGENHFADMTTAEFAKVMNGLKMAPVQIGVSFAEQKGNTSLPKEVDWTKKGYVTPVKNQGQCGSCWSFSATGSLEGAHFKKTGKLVSLSEKNLMDCSNKYGNEGCNGGLMDDAFKYVIDNKGIDTEESYPYKPEDGKCKFNRKNVGATEASFKDVKQGSESDLQKSVAEVGPISVAIDASHFSFQFYHGGVYNEPQCSSTQLDHGVLAVGYGTESGKDYWLVKNSWGPGWGKAGYIMMTRNHENQCGIASSASYPLV